jgi:hypothetical protein
LQTDTNAVSTDTTGNCGPPALRFYDPVADHGEFLSQDEITVRRVEEQWIARRVLSRAKGRDTRRQLAGGTRIVIFLYENFKLGIGHISPTFSGRRREGSCSLEGVAVAEYAVGPISELTAAALCLIAQCSQL